MEVEMAENKKWRWWLDMRSEEFRRLDPERTVALMPIAAVEQHGPHLPVSVDATINRGVVQRASEMMPDDLPVLILPQTDVGKSNEHIDYPGTLTLSAETLIRLWTEYGESVRRAGLRKLVMFNSHGGQPQVMEIVARDLRVRQGMMVVASSWYALGKPPDLFPADEGRYGIHAGSSETSMMLHLAPHTVRMDKARNFHPAQMDLAKEYKILAYTGGVGIAWQSQDLNHDGAVGNALDADAKRGKIIVDHAAGRLVEMLKEVSRFPLDKLKRV
jgi:creatinine amidohydrolase